MLAKSKLNSIERKISEASINNEIKHEDFVTIIVLEWWIAKEVMQRKLT